MTFRSRGGDLTRLLLAWRSGDDTALAALMPLVYIELKRIARHLLRAEHGHETLQTTALVHEAYLRLTGLGAMGWKDRAHFFAMSARLMRRVLVEHARHHARAKRGGGVVKIATQELGSVAHQKPPDLVELDEAMRVLAQHDSQMSHIVELRFFGDLNREEIAEVLGISSATVTRRWRSARAWLVHYLSKEAS